MRKNDKGLDMAKKTVSDGFVNLTSRLGLRGGNINGEGTYTANLITRNRIKLENAYRGSWVVGVAIDSVAEDMTRAGVTIKGNIEPEQIQRLQSGITRIGLWNSLLNLIKWGRLYGGAIGYIDILGQDPATPLNIETVGANQFKGVKIYDRWQLQPSLTLVQGGIDDGLPEYYSVVSDIGTGQISNLKIHHSRALRFIGIQLPVYQAVQEQMWGESIIERLYDRLIAFDTATSGASNLLNKAHLRTVQIDGLREVLAAGGQAEENLLTMFAHMRHLQTNEGITLLDKNDTFAAHNYTFAGISDMVLQFGQQISGALGIPLIRLFGQSPTGMNSTGESDLRIYYDNIMAQQEARLREGLFTVLRVTHKSVLGFSPDDDFDFDFNPLWQTSAKEKVDIATAITTNIVNAYNAGIIDEATALAELKQSSEVTGMYSNIEQGKIDELNAMPELPAIEPAEPVEPVADKKMNALDRIKAWLNV